MREYVEQQFKLSAVQSDGKSLREHLEAVYRITKKMPQELVNLAVLPETMVEIWDWFLELNNTRSSGMGVSPITFTEIKSYFDLYNIEATVTEVQLIKMIDSIALSVSRQQEEENKNKNKQKQK